MFNIRFPDGITAARWSFTATCKITLKTTGKSGNRTVPLPQSGMNINGKFYEKNTAIIGVDYTVTIVFPTGAAPQPTVPPAVEPTSAPLAAVTAAAPVSPEATPAIEIDCADTWRVSRDGESEPYSLTISNKTANDIRALVTFDPPGLVDCDKLAPGGITVRPGLPQIYPLKLSADGVQRLLQDKAQTLTITATWQQPDSGQATATVNVIARDSLLIGLLVIGGVGLVGALATGAFAWLRAKKRNKFQSPERQVRPNSPSPMSAIDKQKHSTRTPGSLLGVSSSADLNNNNIPAKTENQGPTAVRSEQHSVMDQSTAQEEPIPGLPGVTKDKDKELPPDRSTPLDKRLTQLEKLVRELWSELDQEKQRAKTATHEMQALRDAIQPLLSPDWIRQQIFEAGDELTGAVDRSLKISETFREMKSSVQTTIQRSGHRISNLENQASTLEYDIASIRNELKEVGDRATAPTLDEELAERIRIESIKRYEALIVDFVTPADLANRIADAANMQLRAAKSRARQLAWLAGAIAAARAGDSQRLDAERHHWFVSGLIERLQLILEQAGNVPQTASEQASLRDLDIRFQRFLGKIDLFFSGKRLSPSASASDRQDAGNHPIAPEWRQAQACLDEEHRHFWNLMFSQVIPALTELVDEQAQSSVAFREAFLNTLFPELCAILWDTGKALLQARNEMTGLLKELYAHYDVTWIWPSPGNKFDPRLHERRGEPTALSPHGVVANVIALGILDNGRVLRRAAVETSAGNP